jgi:hypothetical protein
MGANVSFGGRTSAWHGPDVKGASDHTLSRCDGIMNCPVGTYQVEPEDDGAA